MDADPFGARGLERGLGVAKSGALPELMRCSSVGPEKIFHEGPAVTVAHDFSCLRPSASNPGFEPTIFKRRVFWSECSEAPHPPSHCGIRSGDHGCRSPLPGPLDRRGYLDSV